MVGLTLGLADDKTGVGKADVDLLVGFLEVSFVGANTGLEMGTS